METAAPQPKRIGRMWLMFDKLGAVGAVLSAVAAPCCFPLFATIGGVLGLGSFPFLRANAPILIQAMTALALWGQIASYRQHRKKGPLLASGVSAGLVAFAYLLNYHVWLIYAALSGLTIAAVWNLVNTRRARSCCRASDSRSPSAETKRTSGWGEISRKDPVSTTPNGESDSICRGSDMSVVRESVLTCPQCGKQSRELMPTDACLFFWDCTGCGARLKPKPGHCCVFCSYGSVKCPPIQAGSGCPPCNCGS